MQKLKLTAVIMSAALGMSAWTTHAAKKVDEPGLLTIGLTDDQRLVQFSTSNPKKATEIGVIAGLDQDTTLVGIDYRPLTNALYGVGNMGGLYLLDPTNAQATLDARLVSTVGEPIVLNGTRFGVDFNPAADALRIVSDTGQNLRALPSDRVVAGTPRLKGTTFIDGSLSTALISETPRPTLAGVAAAGYTNNFAGTATTALYVIDAATSTLYLQSPPNDGTLVLGMSLAIGTPVDNLGFDIHTVVTAGVPTSNTAVVAVRSTGRTRIAEVDLTTGNTTSKGDLLPKNDVIDIAIPTVQPAP